MLNKTLCLQEKIVAFYRSFAKNNEFDYSQILFWMNEDDVRNGLGLFLFRL